MAESLRENTTTPLSSQQFAPLEDVNGWHEQYATTYADGDDELCGDELPAELSQDDPPIRITLEGVVDDPVLISASLDPYLAADQESSIYGHSSFSSPTSRAPASLRAHSCRETVDETDVQNLRETASFFRGNPMIPDDTESRESKGFASEQLPPEVEALFHEDAMRRYEQWWQEREANPSHLNVIVDIPLQVGRRIIVESHSQRHGECTPEDKHALQWSTLLIDETLTPATCEKLEIVLGTIKACQGLSASEALAYLIFLYVHSIDLERGITWQPSLLSADRWVCDDLRNNDQTDTQSENSQSSRVRPAACRLEQILEHWYTFGGKFVAGLRAPEENIVGRWCYFPLPPKWVPSETLEKMHRELTRRGEPITITKVPVFVEPQMYPTVKNIVRLEQDARQIGILTHFNLGVAQTGHQAPFPETVPPIQQQKPYSQELRVSADGRSVNLRGEVFTFTPDQAIIFGILYEAWKNGTPDVSQDYILERLGKEKGRIRDYFKTAKDRETFERLIVKGERRDTFRLNVDLP